MKNYNIFVDSSIEPIRFNIDNRYEDMILSDAISNELKLTGSRSIKRLWKTHTITVNSYPAKPYKKLRNGDIVLITALNQSHISQALTLVEQVHLLNYANNYFAFYKPDGLASAIISGSPALSVEEIVGKNASYYLKSYQSQNATAVKSLINTPLFLCNRLDTQTSGILLFCSKHELIKHFHDLEISGNIQKKYLAIVEGDFTGEISIKNKLDMDNRKKTKALDTPDEEITRHTHVKHLSKIENPLDNIETANLVEISIKRGARHQIRAHLSHIGHPIVGDALYGNGKLDEKMFLHHKSITFPGFFAESFPHNWPI